MRVLERPPVVRTAPERVARKRRLRESKVSLGIVIAAVIATLGFGAVEFARVWPVTEPADAIYFYPQTGTVIGVNEPLLLEGKGKEARRIERLRELHEDLVFKAIDDVVIVKLVPIGTGQALLKPTRPLIPNRKYQLLIDKLVGDAKIGNPSEGTVPEASWITRPAPGRGGR